MSRPALVLLHAVGADARMFAPVVERLEDTGRILTTRPEAVR